MTKTAIEQLIKIVKDGDGSDVVASRKLLVELIDYVRELKAQNDQLCTVKNSKDAKEAADVLYPVFLDEFGGDLLAGHRRVFTKGADFEKEKLIKELNAKASEIERLQKIVNEFETEMTKAIKSERERCANVCESKISEGVVNTRSAIIIRDSIREAADADEKNKSFKLDSALKNTDKLPNDWLGKDKSTAEELPEADNQKSAIDDLIDLLDKAKLTVSFDRFRDITKGCGRNCRGWSGDQSMEYCENHKAAIASGKYVPKDKQR